MTAPRVLIADDDTDLREELASALSEDGYDVDEAADGNELLDALASAESQASDRPIYDVILMDLMMPGFSGVDVLTALHRPPPRVPVLVMTGCEDEHVVQTAASLGAVAVFRKPFALDDLRATLLNVVLHPQRA
ncbi:MAG TPA: response regulator [Polyangiaceae bacterium]|jgi:two-component system response regulator MprA|nr:response regulator [Polyangiaceae bacterium]